MNANADARTLAAALALVLAAGTPVVTAAAGPTPVLSSARFSVRIDGVDVPRMLRVEFPKRAEADDHRGDRLTPVRLTRGLSDVVGGSTDFLKWLQQAQARLPAARKEVTLVLYDAAFAEAGKVVLSQCVALAWNGPDLSATGESGPVVESIDLACRAVQLMGAF